ncbi:hypothetical protein BA891_19500 [Vibrio natriegens]|nr:hypothetical protein BA891_19500 [Vibrio natriegens]
MMEHSIYSRHKRLLSAMLLGAATLYGPGAFAQDPGVQDSCMEDLYGKSLNCTANDINIAEATNIVVTEIDGQPVDPDTTVCVAGKDVTFEADFNVVSTASDRYDIGLYFQRDGAPDALNGSCNIYTLSGEYSTNANNTDGDSCWDVEQAQVVVHSTTITTLCQDTDGDGQLNLPNCVSWRQPGKNEVCNDPTDAFPGAPSKCNCDDDYNIPIFIQPDPPTTEKSVSPSTGTEPGQVFLYTISITPADGTGSEVYVTKIEDEVSSSTNGDSETFVLNGGPGVNDIGVTKGKYTLLSSGLANACEDVVLPYIIPPEAVGLECTYKIEILDSDLPDVDAPELFENYVRSTIVDEYGDAVGDNTCVTPSTVATPNPNCSNEVVVSLTNVPPTISVTKLASPDSIVENTVGIPVTYTVVITNTSPQDDVTITSISDDQYDVSVEAATCMNQVLGRNVGVDDSCTFQYTRNVTGNVGDPAFENTASATAVDDEADEASDSGLASVSFSNSPGAIELTKTPPVDNPAEVTESGGNVTYTFTIENTSPVDSITLKELDDTQLGILFDSGGYQGDCDFYDDVLAPGETRFCTIADVFLQGEPGVPHMNTAEVTGETDDVVPEIVTDTDNGKVVFLNEPADINLSFALSLTLNLNIANASTYEPVNLNALSIAGTPIQAGEGDVHYEITASNCPVSFPYPIAANGEMDCTFSVDLLTPDASADNLFRSAGSGGLLIISVADEDGGPAVEPVITVNAQAVLAP